MFKCIILTLTMLLAINAHADEPKSQTMRITGYVPNSRNGAINKKIVVGRTAAVSRKCAYMLNEDVYVEGHGVWHVNDLTAKWLDTKHNVCTLDLAVPTESHARKIGNKHKQVVRLNANKRTITHCRHCGRRLQ